MGQEDKIRFLKISSCSQVGNRAKRSSGRSQHPREAPRGGKELSVLEEGRAGEVCQLGGQLAGLWEQPRKARLRIVHPGFPTMGRLCRVVPAV